MSISIVSGGAKGSDAAWVAAFKPYATSIDVHVSEKWHVFKDSEGTVYHVLTDVIPDRAALKVLGVTAKALNRTMPEKVALRYILRDRLIAESANFLVAIGKFNRKTNDPMPGVGVEGGTGWTCQFFAEKHAREGKALFTRSMEMYIFAEQDLKYGWYQCKQSVKGKANVYEWRPCAEPELPIDGSKVAMIGTRDITPEGEEAIRSLARSYKQQTTKPRVNPYLKLQEQWSSD